LDLFITFVYVTHAVIVITLTWNQAGYGKLKMDTVRIHETPRAPRTSAVRRSLLTEYEDADTTLQPNSEVEFDLATPVFFQENQEIANQNEENEGVGSFLKYWILVIVLCASPVMMGIYKVFPKIHASISFHTDFHFSERIGGQYFVDILQ
jgi:hypothetical protein